MIAPKVGGLACPNTSLPTDLVESYTEYLTLPTKDEAALAAYFNQFDDTRLAVLEYVVMDMSQAYRNAVEHHTDAVIVYDRCHIMAANNRAVDQVRRQAHKLVNAHGDTTLKRTMHTFDASRKT